MEALTPSDVQAALDQAELEIQVQFMEQPTATAVEAANALNTELGSIVKSLVFMVDGQPIVVLTAGDQRVDDKKIALMFDVPRKKIKIATSEECIAIVGYAPGGVPPLGHRTQNLPLYIDQTLSRYEIVYAAAGAANTIFPIPYEKLIQVTGGIVTDVIKD